MTIAQEYLARTLKNASWTRHFDWYPGNGARGSRAATSNAETGPNTHVWTSKFLPGARCTTASLLLVRVGLDRRSRPVVGGCEICRLAPPKFQFLGHRDHLLRHSRLLRRRNRHRHNRLLRRRNCR